MTEQESKQNSKAWDEQISIDEEAWVTPLSDEVVMDALHRVFAETGQEAELETIIDRWIDQGRQEVEHKLQQELEQQQIYIEKHRRLILGIVTSR